MRQQRSKVRGCGALPGRAGTRLRVSFMLLASLASAGVPPAVQAQASRDVGVLVGVVRDSAGEHLVGADLTVLNSRAGGFSNDTGGFRVLGVPAGRGTLRIRRLGYAPRTVDFTVEAGQSIQLDVVLSRVPLNIDPVVVSADAKQLYTGWAAKFYQRMERGNGRFITRAEIERRNAIRTTDLLRSLPGVQIRPSRMASNTVYLRGQRCTPFIWIDNTPAMAGYVDLDNFEPNSLEGIEIYSSAATVPAELSVPRDKMACGMIVLWSMMPDRPTRGSRGSRYSAADLAALVSSLKIYTAEQVDEQARLDESVAFMPVYPNALKEQGVRGSVLAEFVVDTLGKVELETFGVVTPADPQFIDAVRAALRSARFIPAVREGRLVRQLVHLPVRFDA